VGSGFVARFILPLVAGGVVPVERPIGRRALATLESSLGRLRRAPQQAGLEERRASEAIRHLRSDRASRILGCRQSPDLDEVSLRLAAAVHNLLFLSHPLVRDSERRKRLRMRTIQSTLAIAWPERPQSLEEVVARHTLLMQIPRIRLQRPGPVGRRRFFALTRFRDAPSSVDDGRLWLDGCGIAPDARPIWDRLLDASPLEDALHPLRYEPASSWPRVESILAYRPLCRLVANNVLRLGLRQAGDALVAAFLKHASGSVPAVSGGAARLAFQFFAHLLWLCFLQSSDAGARSSSGDVGPLLACLAATAGSVSASQIPAENCRWLLPPDVPRASPLAVDFLRWLHGFEAYAKRVTSESSGAVEALAAVVNRSC